jgi:hypothetical protein
MECLSRFVDARQLKKQHEKVEEEMAKALKTPELLADIEKNGNIEVPELKVTLAKMEGQPKATSVAGKALTDADTAKLVAALQADPELQAFVVLKPDFKALYTTTNPKAQKAIAKLLKAQGVVMDCTPSITIR